MTNKTYTILLVEDEPALAEILKDVLEGRGFGVALAGTASRCLEVYENSKPDLLLLDISLPDADGYSVARTIRSRDLHTPILFLTSRSLPGDVIRGFENGGNDYVKKPFNIDELVVRIKALLSANRTLFIEPEGPNSQYAVGSYTFYYDQAVLIRNGRKYALTAREAEVLRLLLLNRNQVLQRSVILKQIWGVDDFFAGRSMDVFITKLRRHLKEDPAIQIMNIRGIGYKLIF